MCLGVLDYSTISHIYFQYGNYLTNKKKMCFGYLDNFRINSAFFRKCNFIKCSFSYKFSRSYVKLKHKIIASDHIFIFHALLLLCTYTYIFRNIFRNNIPFTWLRVLFCITHFFSRIC